MSGGIRLVVRVVAVLALGLAVNYGLALWAAPGLGQNAIFVSLLLTTFGAALAALAMRMVMLPLGVLAMVRRVMQGQKPVAANRGHRDALDRLGRALFVMLYALLSAGVGAGIGLVEGGMGLFAAAAVFAVAGALLAMLVPEAVIWASEETVTATTPTAAGRADLDAARRDGVPAVLLADRIARRVINVTIEAPTRPGRDPGP